MFRDRTNLYLSYRQTFPHRSSHAVAYVEHREQSGLLEDFNNAEDIEMSTLHPVQADNEANHTETVMEIEKKGTQLSLRIKENLKKLDRKYREIILPNFDDEFIHHEMKQIDDLSGRIMIEIQSLYKMINQLQQLDQVLTSVNHDRNSSYKDEHNKDNIQSTRTLINNLKRKFAVLAQEMTGQFRDMQGRYVKYLKRDDIEGYKSNDVETYSRNAMVESSKQIKLQKDQQTSNSDGEQLQVQETGISEDYLLQREREIYKISQSVVEISVIFKELENIVIDQGTILDNIVYNLDRTSEQVQGADKELVKAEKYQKQNNKCKLVMFLVLLILFVLMLFMVKPHRVDHYIHDGKPTSGVAATTSTENEQDQTTKLSKFDTIVPLVPIENISSGQAPV